MTPTLPQLREALAAHDAIDLHAPANEEQIAAFETQLGIRLPEELRAFLLEVCDGIGVDGEPRLLAMEDMLVDLAPPPRRPGPSRAPSRPFLYGNDDARALRAAMAAATASLLGDRTFMGLQRRAPYEGCLTVGYDGGNDFHVLVVTGEQRGAIWRTGEIDHPEPRFPAKAEEPGTPLGFIDWFVRWAPVTLGIAWPWARASSGRPTPTSK